MANSKRKQVEAASAPAEESEQTTALAEEIPDELIACRAYEKWQQRGCPLWDDGQDWFAARTEIEQERGVQCDREPSGAAEHAA